MNTPYSLFSIMSPVVPLGWLPVLVEPGCLDPPADAGWSPAERTVCGIGDLSSWVTQLPARLWHATLSGWPWLLAAVLVVLVLAVAVQAVHRAAWRRAVAGYWVRVVPPRLVEPGQAGDGWRLLAGLARLARNGWWRPATPPLAFEVYQQAGRLTAGLWLPGWVPYKAVADEVRRVWPGARLDRTEAPTLTPTAAPAAGGGWPGYGYARTARTPDSWWTTPAPPSPRPGVHPAETGSRRCSTRSVSWTARRCCKSWSARPRPPG